MKDKKNSEQHHPYIVEKIQKLKKSTRYYSYNPQTGILIYNSKQGQTEDFFRRRQYKITQRNTIARSDYNLITAGKLTLFIKANKNWWIIFRDKHGIIQKKLIIASKKNEELDEKYTENDTSNYDLLDQILYKYANTYIKKDFLETAKKIAHQYGEENTFNLNNFITDNDDNKIVCRHLAYFVAKKHIKNYHEDLGSCEVIQSIPYLMSNQFDRFNHKKNYSTLTIFNIIYFGLMLKNKAGQLLPGDETNFLFNSTNHSNALNITYKKNIFIIKFYDPNQTDSHTRVICKDLNSIEHLPVKDIIKPELIKIYFPKPLKIATLYCIDNIKINREKTIYHFRLSDCEAIINLTILLLAKKLKKNNLLEIEIEITNRIKNILNQNTIDIIKKIGCCLYHTNKYINSKGKPYLAIKKYFLASLFKKAFQKKNDDLAKKLLLLNIDPLFYCFMFFYKHQLSEKQIYFLLGEHFNYLNSQEHWTLINNKFKIEKKVSPEFSEYIFDLARNFTIECYIIELQLDTALQEEAAIDHQSAIEELAYIHKICQFLKIKFISTSQNLYPFYHKVLEKLLEFLICEIEYMSKQRSARKLSTLFFNQQLLNIKIHVVKNLYKEIETIKDSDRYILISETIINWMNTINNKDGISNWDIICRHRQFNFLLNPEKNTTTQQRISFLT